MLYYHENQTDETHLDNEPLLQFHKRSQLDKFSKLGTPLSKRYPSLNVSNLFDETDCLVDLSVTSIGCGSSIMENNLDSDVSSDYENAKLDENANIRRLSASAGMRKKSASLVDEHTVIHFDPNADIADNLLAIFVVSFDAKLGNLIEWQMPAHLDLKHIEFKAMASGFHLISSDLVYVCLSLVVSMPDN